MSTTAIVDTRADAELISAVRGGDVEAYGVLFERHVDAARRLARQLVSAGDADDLVSEAFVKVLAVLQRGGGPDVAFRAYLLTSVRRLRVDRIRATSKLHTTDEIELFDPGIPFRDTTIEGFENAAAARAFASLPERWQLVLWHTEVEEQKPAEIAPLLAMSANSVSALAYRAREGLRQAFLNEHVAALDDDTCRWTHEHLGGYIRKGLAQRDVAKVEDHLTECRTCAAIYLELVEVNSNLGAIIGPLLLGGAAAAYAAATSGASAGGILIGLLDRAKDLVAGHAPVAAVGGVTSAAVVAGLAFVTLGDAPDTRVDPSGRPSVVSAPRAPGQPASASPRRAGAKAATADRRTPNAAARGAGTDTAAPVPIGAPISDPTTSAEPSPTSLPTSTTTSTSTSTSSPTPVPTPTAPTPTKATPTGSPTTNATTNATPGPTSKPTSKPTSSGTPTDGPTNGPTSTPTPTPTAAPTPTTATRDLAITITTTDRKALFEDLAIMATGVPAGESATVTISGTNVMQLSSGDPRCQAGESQIVCRVTDSAPMAVRAQRLPNSKANITAVVSSDDGVDGFPDDNSAAFVLDSH